LCCKKNGFSDKKIKKAKGKITINENIRNESERKKAKERNVNYKGKEFVRTVKQNKVRDGDERKNTCNSVIQK
jgi:hypothetical protein